jgi:hypothetical protein
MRLYVTVSNVGKGGKKKELLAGNAESKLSNPTSIHEAPNLLPF